MISDTRNCFCFSWGRRHDRLYMFWLFQDGILLFSVWVHIQATHAHGVKFCLLTGDLHVDDSCGDLCHLLGAHVVLQRLLLRRHRWLACDLGNWAQYRLPVHRVVHLRQQLSQPHPLCLLLRVSCEDWLYTITIVLSRCFVVLCYYYIITLCYYEGGMYLR